MRGLSTQLSHPHLYGLWVHDATFPPPHFGAFSIQRNASVWHFMTGVTEDLIYLAGGGLSCAEHQKQSIEIHTEIHMITIPILFSS